MLKSFSENLPLRSSLETQKPAGATSSLTAKAGLSNSLNAVSGLALCVCPDEVQVHTNKYPWLTEQRFIFLLHKTSRGRNITIHWQLSSHHRFPTVLSFCSALPHGIYAQSHLMVKKWSWHLQKSHPCPRQKKEGSGESSFWGFPDDTISFKELS